MTETIPECPGRSRERVPFPEDRPCPNCGRIVEVWSNERRRTCVCGTIVWIEQIPSCANWCKEAEKCFGIKPKTISGIEAKAVRIMQEFEEKH